MLAYIAKRAEFTLLFARPQSDTNGSARLYMQRVKDAHGFHGDNHASAIVGSSCAGGPAVQVASNHHHLVFQLRISAGDLRDGVVALFVVAREFSVDSDRDSNRYLVLEQAAHAAEVFAGDNSGWNRLFMIGQVSEFDQLLAVVVAHDTPVPGPSVDQNGRRMFIGEEPGNLRQEANLLKGILPIFRPFGEDMLLLHVAVQRVLVNL